MALSWFRLLSLAALATASFHGNLNYRLPSNQHAGLGIDVPLVQKRSEALAANSDSGRFLSKFDKRSSIIPIDPSKLSFTHGVASGDPYPHSVILWTRVAPSALSDAKNTTVEGDVPLFNHDTEEYIAADPNPICVEWKIAKDQNFHSCVDQGTVYTTSDIDYTVKVEAKKLYPFETYYYQFNVCNSTNVSPVGRTKTSPDENDDCSKISLAVFSCSNFPNGYFNAYGNSARRDKVDFFVHLSDYTYEKGPVGKYGTDPRAVTPSRYLFTLYDYRTRHGLYRTDADLNLAHQKFAWIPVWDDNDIADNTYRDGSAAMNNTEQSFNKLGYMSFDQRKMNAVRAYFEWMPIRQVDMDDNLRTWRSFKMGKLLDLIMIDTRNYDRSITSLGWNNDFIPKIMNDAGRSLIGSHQENWFYRQLSESQKRGATWRLIGNQIVFSMVNGTFRSGDSVVWMDPDAWDGYQGNRNRTLNHLYTNKINNNIFLSGDSHVNWANDLAWIGDKSYDPATGNGSIGVEFGVTAVTSAGFGGTIARADKLSVGYTDVRYNPEVQWSEGHYRGHYELHISPASVNAHFYGNPTVTYRNPLEMPIANFTVQAGVNHLQRPVAEGSVASGALQTGKTVYTNATLNTETGVWNTTSGPLFDTMLIAYA